MTNYSPSFEALDAGFKIEPVVLRKMQPLEPDSKIVKSSPLSETYLARRDELRQIASSEYIAPLERLMAAGSLLFYFRYETAVEYSDVAVAKRLLQLEDGTEDRLEVKFTETTAWLQTLVGKDYFDRLQPADIEGFFMANMVNGLDSDLAHAKKILRDSYAELHILTAQKVKNSKDPMLGSIYAVSYAMIEYIAKNYDVDEAKLIGECEENTERISSSSNRIDAAQILVRSARQGVQLELDLS